MRRTEAQRELVSEVQGRPRVPSVHVSVQNPGGGQKTKAKLPLRGCTFSSAALRNRFPVRIYFPCRGLTLTKLWGGGGIQGHQSQGRQPPELYWSQGRHNLPRN